MKKLYMYMIIIFSIMILPVNVKAFTTGAVYSTWSSTNNNKEGTYTCPNTKTMCSINRGITPIDITCDTNYCFIQFTSVSTQAPYSGAYSQFISTYTQVYNGTWNPCETIGGVATCMVQKNTRVTNVELKFVNYYNDFVWAIDLNSGTIFNSPDDVSSQLNNIQQQQQIQNQIVNNTDSSGNATDFNNTVSNATLPNNSHGFDILGSLQNFISGIEVSGSCSRISVPIPFTNQTLTLPCMTTDVYSVHFPEVVVIWQLIVRGLGYYYILVNILRLIKETIDPFNFKLEVMDL